MPYYFATARKEGYPKPFSLHFNADNPMEAIKELCKAADAHDTSGLVEFEILEVLANNQYRIAASKSARKERIPIEVAETDKVISTEENTYTPYSVKQAA